MSSPRRLPAEPPLTVESALRVPALRRGAPRVLAGRDQLGRPVRWAHSCEARHIPDLLEGQELLLMTGMGLASSGPEQRAFVRALVARDVAAVVVELGRVFSELPEPLVREARRLHLPLVVLEQEVRFVEATKQLHTAILSRQMTLEHNVAELHGRLTEELVDGADVPRALGLLAHALGNPVLLERTDGALLFHAAGDSEPEELLARWRLLRDAEDVASVAAIAELHEAGRRPWGRLVVVPHERPVDAASRLAVARIAPLLALVLVRARVEDELQARERGNLLHDVMTGRVAPEDVPVHAATAGVELHGDRLLALAIAARSAPARAPGGEALRGGSAAAGGAVVRGGSAAAGGAVVRGGSAAAGGVVVRGGSAAAGGAVVRGGSAAAGGVVVRGGSAAAGGAVVRGAATVGVVGVAEALRRALAARGVVALLGARPGHDDLLVLVELGAGAERRAAIDDVVAAVHAQLGPATTTLAAGPTAEGWGAVPGALAAAVETADTMRDAPPGRVHDATVPDVERLLWALRDQEPLARFARARLARVLEHDRRHAARLLPTLQALAACHWHKADAARALGIRRQSLYAQLTRLERLLDADLDDPDVRLGLDLALRALAVVA